jgi:formylglycine-generating enzyme required for sulfatase activity
MFAPPFKSVPTPPPSSRSDSRRPRRGRFRTVVGLFAALLCAPGQAAAPETAVLIPAGSFQQGSPLEPDAPQRTVQLSAFRIARTEVSVAEFERFVADGGYSSARWWSEAGDTWRSANPHGAGAEVRAAGRAATHPVVGVTYFEAEAYCAWAGGRLPTEAEWERAACGTDGRRYPWGDSEAEAARWYAGGKFGSLTKVDTAPVEEQDAQLLGPDGLAHMAGNVWEWTADRYHATAWGGTGTADPRSTANTPWHTLRGGSFMNLPSYCSCRHREPARPDRVALTVGFRCVWEAQ